MISSTMQEFPLTITAVLRHGMTVYADAECVTWTESGPRRATYGTIGANAGRLAHALTRLGVGAGRSGRHVHVELAGAHGGVSRDPVDGRGRPHA